MRAKFLFIRLILIKLFDSRMRIGALITIGAFLSFADIFTHVFGIKIPVSLPVFRVVIVNTMLVNMLLGI